MRGTRYIPNPMKDFLFVISNGMMQEELFAIQDICDIYRFTYSFYDLNKHNGINLF